MKRIQLTDEQMNRVIKMRARGISWSGIQDDTGIPRRVAQRAYTEWEQNRVAEQLKEVRRELAVEDFRKHRDLLVRLAGELANHIKIPNFTAFTVSADEHMSKLRERAWWAEEGEGIQVYSRWTENELNADRIRKQNDMLFKSLQVHTKGKVRWVALGEWKSGWDVCKEGLEKLNIEIPLRVGKGFQAQPELVERFEEAEIGKIVESITRGIKRGMWLGLLDDKSTVTLAAQEGDRQERNPISFTTGDLIYLFEIPWISKRLYGILLEDLNAITGELYRGETTQKIGKNIRKMSKASAELEEGLNPLVLGPLILATRCDLCPV